MRPPARLVVLAAALVLAGCGAPSAAPPPVTPTAEQTAPTTAARPSPSATTGPATVTATPKPATTKVPDSLRFTSRTVAGEPFDGATLAGQPVLLWFWAPWCPTCRGQVDDVEAVTRTYRGRVAVIGVGSLSDDPATIRRFAADAPGPIHLDDSSGAVFRHFGVVQQSSFVLLDAQGRTVWSVGYGGSDDLADRVAAVAG